jgi:hypothetical protein
MAIVSDHGRKTLNCFGFFNDKVIKFNERPRHFIPGRRVLGDQSCLICKFEGDQHIVHTHGNFLLFTFDSGFGPTNAFSFVGAFAVWQDVPSEHIACPDVLHSLDLGFLEQMQPHEYEPQGSDQSRHSQ